jgi:thiosulfate/3-mercaptopyruvate sulfurtransferase
LQLDPNDPVTPPEALIAKRGSLLALDARSEADFTAGHPAGAVRLPIEAWERAAKTSEGALSNAVFWAEQIGGLGVDGSVPVAVLDDGRITEAARAWFILQHFGVPALVVDGGWPALEPLLRDAGAIEQGPGQTPVALAFAPKPGSGRVALAEREPLRDALEEGVGAPQVFDARTKAEHAGEDLRKNRRGGHLPGAANLPHAALLGEGNRFRPAAALQEMLGCAGLEPAGRLVTHCDGGGRASLAALAAVRAGYGDVATYYLSFADWAADESCPIAR